MATGFTVTEIEQEIREEIEFHIEGLIEDGLSLQSRQASFKML
jgi:predicted RNase H-like HicB family nuclease